MTTTLVAPPSTNDATRWLSGKYEALATMPDVESDVTRRRLLGAGSGLAAGLLLAGCGDDADPAAEGSPPDSAAGALRTIRDAYGSVQVPDRAERIVVMDLSMAVNLNVFSVAQERIVGSQFAKEFADADPNFDYRADIYEWEKITDVGNLYTPLDIEKIVGLRPDLILTLGNPPNSDLGLREPYDQLRATGIPVYAATYEFSTFTGCLEFARMTGDAAGDQAEATAAISTTEQRVTDLRDRLSERGALPNVAVLRASGDSIASFTHPILDELGLPGNRPSPKDFAVFDYSLERIGDFAEADWIFLHTGADNDSQTLSRQLTENPLFTRLPAAQAGRVVDVSPAWAGVFDLLSFDVALDEIERNLLG